jgi:hypothetical protein
MSRSYHKKSRTSHDQPHSFKVHGTGGATVHAVDGTHVFHTKGPGSWMDVPQTGQQPPEQCPPTDAHPLKLHHQMALPYAK